MPDSVCGRCAGTGWVGACGLLGHVPCYECYGSGYAVGPRGTVSWLRAMFAAEHYPDDDSWRAVAAQVAWHDGWYETMQAGLFPEVLLGAVGWRPYVRPGQAVCPDCAAFQKSTAPFSCGSGTCGVTGAWRYYNSWSCRHFRWSAQALAAQARNEEFVREMRIGSLKPREREYGNAETSGLGAEVT